MELPKDRIVKIRYSKKANINQLEELKLMLNYEIGLIDTRIKQIWSDAKKFFESKGGEEQ